MEIDKSKLKAGLIVAGVAILFIILVYILASASSNKEDKTNFPDYDNLNISEKDVSDKSSPTYAEIKDRLETDYLFGKEALISNYNYKFYSGASLQQMVWNYIFAFELNNKKYLSSIDYSTGNFCMRSKYVIDSFEELYGVKISENIDLLDGYYEYVKSRGNNYCFNFGNVARDYNNEIKIMVDAISVKEGIVTTNLYLFEYYITDTPKELQAIDELNISIKNSNAPSAINIVQGVLNGKTTHKQIQFKINNSGKFFKYQILNSKNLEY